MCDSLPLIPVSQRQVTCGEAQATSVINGHDTQLLNGLAVGQNSEAAYLSGVRVKTTRLVAYVISGALAALGGVLLSARVGGAFLEMGNPFLL